jgi:hypothetical protein
MAMAYKKYTGISSATICGDSVTGIQSYSVDDSVAALTDISDDDVYPQGAEKGAGAVRWSVVTDDPLHAQAPGDSGNGGFTEKQAATSKAHTIANQVVETVSRMASSRKGAGSSTISGIANSADGSTSPVGYPS